MNFQAARCAKDSTAGGGAGDAARRARAAVLRVDALSATEIDVPNKLQPPSANALAGHRQPGARHRLPADRRRRARLAIAVGLIAVGIGIAGGVALGLLAAAPAAEWREAVMRRADVGLAFPALLWPPACSARSSGRLSTAIVAIGLFNIPSSRVSHAPGPHRVRSREFVLAGAPGARRDAHHARARAAQRGLGADRAGDGGFAIAIPRRGRGCPSSASVRAPAAELGPHAPTKARA